MKLTLKDGSIAEGTAEELAAYTHKSVVKPEKRTEDKRVYTRHKGKHNPWTKSELGLIYQNQNRPANRIALPRHTLSAIRTLLWEVKNNRVKGKRLRMLSEWKADNRIMV